MNIFEPKVSFETAKLLKQIGFNVDCRVWYDKDGQDHFLSGPIDWNSERNNCFSCPTLSTVQQWLRELKKINIAIDCRYGNWSYIIEDCSEVKEGWRCVNGKMLAIDAGFSSYNEALETGIQIALNIFKK